LLALYDAAGRQVITKQLLHPGNGMFSSVVELPLTIKPGLYHFVVVNSNNNQRNNTPVLVQ
jgi:hypothetical protein